ncbi:MAG TPA: cbb3-type cytochrome c oxidase subunit I, partial [Thermoflexales bacterium]|nr:cbb3-type cytochrome c oxidase subunit I [Thermoflexales bacterium]
MATISVPANKKQGLSAEIWSWLTTVDHKKIRVMYLVMSMVFFVIAGSLALVIRLQLSAPGLTIVDPNTYDELFTMHGSAMIFLVVIPCLIGGFGNYFVPLQIGARDVAFPRINALSFWLVLFAGLVMLIGFLLGQSSNAAWTAYVPLSSKQFSPQVGMDIWLMGVILMGISSTLGAVNFLVTVYAMRAPGMTAWRIPMFTWAMITTAAMILMATPVLTAALIMLVTDRNFNTQFFT